MSIQSISREDAIKELFKISPDFVNYIYKHNKNIYHLFYILVLNKDNINPDDPPAHMIAMENPDSYIHRYHNIYFYYSSLCHITFNLFIFLEVHHILLKNDPNLSELYHLMPELIDKLIDMLSSSSNESHSNSNSNSKYPRYECRCDYYYGYGTHIYPLMDEYEELYEYTSNLPDLEEKLKVEYPYTERNSFRIYNLNFINPHDCCHDKDKMISELNHWKKYFHKRCPCCVKYNSDTKLPQHCCFCTSLDDDTLGDKTSVKCYKCNYFNDVCNILSLIKIKNGKHIPHDCSHLIVSYL